MEDGSLTRILANVPPSKWAQTMARYQVVLEYLALQNPTIADADMSAERLGVRRRMFYNIINRYQALSNPGLRSHVRADNRSLDPASINIVDAVIGEVGGIASQADIIRRVQDQCAAAGVHSHSEGVVRTRIGRLRRKFLEQRLGVSAELILDCCALQVDVDGDDGAVHAAGLVAVVDITTGTILASSITAGAPTSEEGVECILSALGASCNAARTIRQTGGAARLDEDRLNRLGLIEDRTPSRFIRMGLPLTVAVGPRLGRIPLRPLNRKFVPALRDVILPRETVSAVAGYLIEQYNHEVAGTSIGRSPGLRPLAICNTKARLENDLQSAV